MRAGGIGEVLKPPRENISEEEGGRGADVASNDIITAMAGMEVGGEEMDEVEGGGQEAMTVCESLQMCTGLEVVI